jgi:hypothetical protein
VLRQALGYAWSGLLAAVRRWETGLEAWFASALTRISAG